MKQAIKDVRRVDLDWIRVFAVLLLVPFHSALIFIPDPDVIMYVKDETYSSFLNHFAGNCSALFNERVANITEKINIYECFQMRALYL